MVSLVQYLEPYNNEQNESWNNNYCVCESCNVSVDEPQNALTEFASIFAENATQIAMGEGPALK